MNKTEAPSKHVPKREVRDTREAIVRVATRLMHVHGYNGTSLDDVLRDIERVVSGLKDHPPPLRGDPLRERRG